MERAKLYVIIGKLERLPEECPSRASGFLVQMFITSAIEETKNL